MKTYRELLTSALDTASRPNRINPGEEVLYTLRTSLSMPQSRSECCGEIKSTFYFCHSSVVQPYAWLLNMLNHSGPCTKKRLNLNAAKKHSVYTVNHSRKITLPACYPVSAKFRNSGTFAHIYYRP
jgi:hypothetical protein